MKTRDLLAELRRDLSQSPRAPGDLNSIWMLRRTSGLEVVAEILNLIQHFPAFQDPLADLLEAVIENTPRMVVHQRFSLTYASPGSTEARAILERAGRHWCIAAALSLHVNGHVRERAVILLGANPDLRVLPFILNRTSDWVEPVAQAAIAAFEAHPGRHSPEAVMMTARAIQKRSRGYRPTYTPDASSRGLEHAVAGDSSLALFVLEPHQTLASDDPIFLSALKSPHGVVRARVAQLLDPGPEVAEWAARFLLDPYPPVRLIALEYAVKAGKEGFPVLERAVHDDNCWVRSQARIVLGPRDYAAVYRAEVPDPGAIEGLGETGSRADADVITPLMTHPASRVRRATVRALVRLDARAALPQVRRMLFDPSARVVREAVQAVGAMNASFDPDEVVSALHFLGRPAPARRASLDALAFVARWDAAIVLLQFSHDPELAELCEFRLDLWAGRMESRLSRARPEVLAEFTRRLKIVPWLPAPLIARLRAILGLATTNS